MTVDFGITPELVAFVKKQEGWINQPYRDPVGLPTLGYGHRIPDMEHPRITLEEGEAILKSDLRQKRDAIVAISPMLAQEDERRVAALIDFAFNCGEGAYRTSTMRKRVEARDWKDAAVEMRRWVHAGGRVFEPLVERRATTARWLEEGSK